MTRPNGFSTSLRAPAKRKAWPVFIVMVGAITLLGCASVADDPTVPAFASVASDSRTAFATARQGDQDAFADQAMLLVVDGGGMSSAHCLVGPDAIDEARACTAVIINHGAPVDLGPVGDKLAADADRLAAYGEGLQRLAAAQDVADQRSAINALGASAGNIFSLVGIPGVSAVTNLVSDLIAQAQLQHRRVALSRIAAATQPAIDALARKMQQETGLMRVNIVLGRVDAVRRAQARFVGLAPGDPARADAAGAIFEAASRERAAAEVTVDFSALPKAHAAMIASLNNPKVSIQAALAEIGALDGELRAVAAAFKSTTS